MTESKKLLWHWSYNFLLTNIVIFWLVGLNYLIAIIPADIIGTLSQASATQVFSKLFIGGSVLLAYFGHFALLACLPFILIIAPLVLLFPKRFIVMGMAIISIALAIIFLIIDSEVFTLYRFHLSTTIFNMIFNRHASAIFQFSFIEYLIGFAIILAILLIETSIALFIWKKTQNVKFNKKLLITSFTFLGFSYLILTLSLSVPTNRFITQTAALPYYNELLAKFLPINDIDRIGETRFPQLKQATAKLNYPQQSLHCQPVTQPYNLLLIVIDSWRFDTVKKALMPYATQFAKQAWQFENHYSGGNSTQAGIFSLFYGLPINYWSSMLAQKQSPVLLQMLQKQNYQLGIFSAEKLQEPAFDKTVFRTVKNLRSIAAPGATPADKDRYITKELKKFLIKQSTTTEPFFAFAFYNSAHGFCKQQNFASPHQPAAKYCNHLTLNNQTNPEPYRNRYYNALHFLDGQLQELLQTAKQIQLLKNTVIILTSDHGEEFNDSRQNYWRHASNFTRYQTQVPLIIYWPKKTPKIFSHQTSHYDMVPTLMQEILACKAPTESYSIGYSLLNQQPRPYLIAGGYINFGIIEADRITTLFTSGRFTVADLQAKPLPTAKPNAEVLAAVFKDMRRFYKNTT